MIADAQFERYRVLSLALGELNSLARALQMNPDPALLASAFGPPLAMIADWLNVGLGEAAPANSHLGQAGSDYFADVLDVAIQHIRDNLANNPVIDKADPADPLCAIPGVLAHHDPNFGIYCCDRAFTEGVPYLGFILIHEYFHAIGLAHGREPAIPNIDSCAYSSAPEEKLDNPYCMTGLAEHIAYGSVWWHA